MIILALLMFQQIPVTYADTTWPMYGATLENTHYQKMVGAMEAAPDIKWSFQTQGCVECYGAMVADVDGDSSTEVLFGSCDYKLYCLNGVTGTIKWNYPTGAYVISSPAAADVDGDGGIEVVFGSNDKKVYCVDGTTGLLEWSYPTGRYVHSSPAIADVDGDGGIEVVIGSDDDKVYCLNGVTGLVEWSYNTGNWVISSPAVADVDGDGEIEIVVGSCNKKVHCLNGTTGLLEWSYTTGDMVYSSPAVADVDGDGGMEIVIGSYDHKVYCLNGVTGSVEWSYPTGARVESSPAVADLDEDGGMEVVIGSGSKVYCLNGVTGLVEWSYDAGGTVHRGISVADLDGDVADECKLEVLVPNVYDDLLVCLNGENGSVLWKKQITHDIHDITIADIDNDGCVELVAGTQYDFKFWALDDVLGASDCECSPNSVEEESQGRLKPSLQPHGIKFRAVSKGTGRMPVLLLFTSNATEIDLRLYDACGRLKQVLYKGVLAKGGHTFMPGIQGSGIYFAVLRTHEWKKSLKITRF